MKTLFILSISFMMLTSFSTANSTSTLKKEADNNEVYVKYSNGDITGLSGYDLLSRVDKELNCDFIANEHYGICPYNKACSDDHECLEHSDTSCICYFLHGGGCYCSLSGICVAIW